MSDFEIKHPEYLSWDIEKLRSEYHKVNLELLAMKIREHRVTNMYQDVQQLANLLKRIAEDEA